MSFIDAKSPREEKFLECFLVPLNLFSLFNGERFDWVLKRNLLESFCDHAPLFVPWKRRGTRKIINANSSPCFELKLAFYCACSFALRGDSREFISAITRFHPAISSIGALRTAKTVAFWVSLKHFIGHTLQQFLPYQTGAVVNPMLDSLQYYFRRYSIFHSGITTSISKEGSS